MCIHLFLHNTSPEHDTRFLAVLNAITGYTVYSPFQDPYVKACGAPCFAAAPSSRGLVVVAGGDIQPHEHCLWHPACCRLERSAICRQPDPRRCTTWTKYHHYRHHHQHHHHHHAGDTGFLHLGLCTSHP
ncbi:hypothetical protein F4780DRAFT_781815 [Xylariomycetidae sp. FL0641]|nr:hypothetical protein F4780DRAFT_781815 [Xylariomycetidae sp. FL0641]